MSPHGSPGPGDPQSKHEVFLSHSGAQKGFVRQLDVDLRSWDMHPFFDKDRDSLPIGVKFPELIFKAIEECEVGVVILSQEFFTLSHWPMTELVGMVNRGRQIMPIFLGISPSDLSSGENLQRWRSQWHKWANSSERVKLSEWDDAVKLLKGLNGLVYDHAAGVVEFRKEIVKEIRKKVRPSYRWDDSHVQGRSRLSQSLQEKIRKTRAGPSGVQVVGLYGVGGSGKTTACKSLCKDLFWDFDGRVCHVEFGTGITEKERIQKVLLTLTDANKEFLKDKDESECWSLLKKQKHSNRVFLAMDNVLGLEFIEEAKKYVRAACQGSIVMVTTRARGDLKYLGIVDGNCHEIPELEEIEAKSLFLYHAEVNYEVDEEVVRQCVKRCHFSKGDGKSFHWHPLALKVLGSEMGVEDPSKWESKLKEVDVFNQRRDVENRVLSILRWSFDMLCEEDKLLFMDVALFDSVDLEHIDWRRRSVFPQFYDKERTWCLYEWLSVVHNLRVDKVKERLDILKKKSLLEEVGVTVDNLKLKSFLGMVTDRRRQIGMHDLWREFALMESKKGEMEGGRWVYEVVRGEAEDSSLAGGGWKDLRGICVMNDLNASRYRVRGSVKCLNFSNCLGVTVLRLLHVDVENNVLDLSALKQLRSLEIVHAFDDPSSAMHDPRMYNKQYLKVSGIRHLSNLKLLIWLDIGQESVMAVEEISCLPNLQVLQLKSGPYPARLSRELDLHQLRWLREVRVKFGYLHSILGLSSRMTDLRLLDLRVCRNLRSCPGVGDILGLDVLLLSYCTSLKQLPDLKKLAKLRVLDAGHCTELEAIPGLGSLVALQELRARWCSKLKELPDMSKLRNLAVLDVQGCELLQCIPGLGNLVALQELHVNVESLNDLPDRVNLPLLHRVEIYGQRCGEHFSLSADLVGDEWNAQELHVLNSVILESVSTLGLSYVDHELTNLSRLTALRTLALRDCSLESLPHMGKPMRLEKLIVNGCSRLRRWDGVGRLGSSDSQTGVDLHCDWTLPHLQVLVWHDCGEFELPDLSHFPLLRELSSSFYGVRGKFLLHSRASHLQLETLSYSWSQCTELPDFGKFPCLKKLEVSLCDNLTSLPISGPLTALESLEVSQCSNLNVLPSVDLFPGLRSLRVEWCGVELDEQEVEKLRARGFDFSGRFWVFNPKPWRDGVVSESEPNFNSGEQLGLEGANDAAGPSWREVDSEPRSSGFIPYDESTTECAPVLEPAAAFEPGLFSEKYVHVSIVVIVAFVSLCIGVIFSI